MKGRLWTILAVMVILSLGLAACGSKPTPTLKGREVVIAVENAYPPYNFIEPTNAALADMKADGTLDAPFTPSGSRSTSHS